MTIDTPTLISVGGLFISVVGIATAFVWRWKTDIQMESRYQSRIDHLEKVVEKLERKVEENHASAHKDLAELRKEIKESFKSINDSINQLTVSLEVTKVKTSRTRRQQVA